MKRIFTIMALILISTLYGCGDKPNKQATSMPLPANEEAFIAIVSKAQSEGINTENDMQRGGVKSARDQEICALLSDLNIQDWIGKIHTINANSDGKGVLSIEISKNIIFKTWNNALSDLRDHTLIDPGSTLFNTASAMKKGDLVEFSGTLIAGQGVECVRESSLTLRGKLENPEFILKFSSVGTPTLKEPAKTLAPVAETATAPAPVAENAATPASVAETAAVPAPAVEIVPASTEDNSPFAPSFDCTKASAPHEKMVCGDRELSKLDNVLSKAYSQAKEQTTDKNKLKKDQLEWMKTSLRACSDKACLVGAYKQRISELQ